MENRTKDDFLGGKVSLFQPTKGYRAGLDAVMLGAAVMPKPGQRILDVGCGVGAALLCSAYHNPESFYIGVEIQDDLVGLARENIDLNGKTEVCQIIQGDITHTPFQIPAQSFDQIMTNPPYFTQAASTPSPLTSKATSHIETGSLSSWMVFCLRALKPRGFLTLIYPTDRLDDILSTLHGKVGDIKILPLWPKDGKPAKRILLQARKNRNSGVTLLPGLILHQADGSSTKEAKAILEGTYQIPLFSFYFQ